VSIVGATMLFASTSARAQTCVIEYIGTELLGNAKFCASSELKPQGVGSYGPENLGGRTSETYSGAWCEGAKGNGIGQWVSVNIYVPVKTLWVENGYQKSNKTFTRNNRVRRAIIETASSGSFEVTLKDAMGRQHIYLPNWEKSGKVKLTILSVYSGSHYKDTCISLMWPDAEELRELEFQRMND